MGFVKRVSGLVSANLNDLIDQCENPEKMLRQAIREMETALGQLMDGAARAIAHHKLLTRQLEEQQEEVQRSGARAARAVERGDESAARAELRHKSEHKRFAERLAVQVDSADALGRRLRNQVTTMRLKLAEARRKLADITARHRAAVAQRKFIDNLPAEPNAGHVSSTFDSMCARVEQSEAETEALLELLGVSQTSKPDDDEIEAELRALKEAADHVAH